MNLRRESRERPAVKFEILDDTESRKILRERTQELMDQIEKQGVDTVIFLDRSARPISWLMREMWKEREMSSPEIKFLNIGHSTLISEGGHEILQSTNGTHSDGSSFVSSATRQRIQENEWLSPRDIPREWKSGLLDNADVIKKVGNVFGHHLEGKKVLILDELIASGKSLLAAIGALELSCPEIESVQGTGVFFGEMIKNKNTIPWLRVPGMAGVLEISDEPFLSTPITEDRLVEVRQKLKMAYEQEVIRVRGDFKKLLEAMEAVELFLRDDALEQIIDSRIRDIIKKTLPNTIEKIKSILGMNGLEGLGSLGSDLSKLTETFWSIDKDLERSSIIKEVRDIAYLSNKIESSEAFSHMNELAEQISIDYKDVNLLKKRADQLRGEIKQLAQES